MINTHGSLFSGIGGFDLGFEQAGIQTIWQVEINPFSQEILRSNFPLARIIPDIQSCYGYLIDIEDMAGKPKKISPRQLDTCIHMYESGMSVADIANYFDVSRQGLWERMKGRVAMRPQVRYGSDNHFYRGGETEDDQAQNLVETAIEQGVLVRPEICEQCNEAPAPFKDGRSGIQAHHPDYNKPLEVMWLCQKCHHEWHKKNTARKKEVPQELNRVDILSGGFP